MAMTRNDAQVIASRELERLFEGDEIAPVILEDATREEDFGWVFFYESRRYLETRNRSHQLVGNGPLIVDRQGGLHHLTSSEPPSTGIRRLREAGAFRPPDQEGKDQP